MCTVFVFDPTALDSMHECCARNRSICIETVLLDPVSRLLNVIVLSLKYLGMLLSLNSILVSASLHVELLLIRSPPHESQGVEL